jgi:glutathione peroxidase
LATGDTENTEETEFACRMQKSKTIRGIKRIGIGILIFLVAFTTYVLIVNRNSKDMTARQMVLKAVYPVLMGWNKLTGKKTVALEHDPSKHSSKSFYDLSATLNNGQVLSFSSLKGKKVLLVNTASDCGYTNQYEALQQLYETEKSNLVIIGFPANDFKEQEKGNDEEIAQFCKINFGVSFPLAKKSTVIKGADQNAVFNWLTDKNKNGWNDKAPSWNFSKYLVNEEGELTNYFDPAISPMSEEVTKAVHGAPHN